MKQQSVNENERKYCLAFLKENQNIMGCSVNLNYHLIYGHVLTARGESSEEELRALDAFKFLAECKYYA